ncbi:DUF3631 domain-containing protein, partial [Mycobacterium simiae]
MPSQTAYERIIGALRDRGSKTNERRDKAQCPAHDDDQPSLSISPRRDGKGIVIKCHAGCDYQTVLTALGMAPRDLFDDAGMRGIYSARRDYRYPDGRVVHRTPGKKFWQENAEGRRSLFRAEFGQATTVYVTEGEKDVLAIESVGGAATCSAMGAGKADKFDWEPLRAKAVIVIADKDEPGRKHAAQVAGLLRGIAASVSIAESAVGKDAADHIAAGYGLDELVPADVVARDGGAPQNGAALLDDLRSVLTKYVVLPDQHAGAAVTLWIAATHALPAFECAPRLIASSPDKRCGKTRLLDIITGTCHQPLATVNATVAAIFRSIGADHPPTLLIDEADTLFGSKRVAEQNEDLRALLNAGHQRGRPALRCVGPSQIPTKFPTFAMAALAGIGAMPDTITDRGVNITMRRRTTAEKVAQFRTRRDGPILQAVRDKLAAWAAEHLQELAKVEPDMPVEDRAADTWEPLIAVADAAGGHWPATARAACAFLANQAGSDDEEQSLGVKLLADIRSVFAERGVPFLPSGDLAHELRRIEESPWNDFDLNPSKLAFRLKAFGIKPHRNTVGSIRGYSRETLSDAFTRY